MIAAYTNTSAKSFLPERIQKKCRMPRPAIRYTSLCSSCQRLAPSFRMAALNEVAASRINWGQTPINLRNRKPCLHVLQAGTFSTRLG